MDLLGTMNGFLLSIFLGINLCQLTGDTSWDILITTLPKFISVPTTETDAIISNWTAIMTCNDIDSPGNVYWINEDLAAMPIYNTNGQIAGIIIGINDPGEYAQIAPWQPYNATEATICDVRSTIDIKYGDRLWITDENPTYYTKIPLTESSVALENEGWIKGGCEDDIFVYYWRYSTPDIDCNDAYPVFIIYDNGILNAWGVAMRNEDRPLPNAIRWEHPSGSVLTDLFLPGDAPTCLAEQTQLYNSIHVYISSSVLAEATAGVSTSQDDSQEDESYDDYNADIYTAVIFGILGGLVVLVILVKCVKKCQRECMDDQGLQRPP